MIEQNYFWTIILLLGLGTFGIRVSLIYLSAKFEASERLKEVFSFIPAAVLPALVTPLVFFHEGTVNFLLHKERLVVLAAASLLCFVTKSIIATVLFGFGALYLLTQFL